jgi:polyhydroxyalkanoate synthesis regulator phasin
MGSKRRGNTFSRFLEDIVDDTKDFVDDLIDRAKDVEENARDAVVDLVDDDDEDEGEGETGDATEAAALRKQLDELRAKIDQLTAMQQSAAPESTA